MGRAHLPLRTASLALERSIVEQAHVDHVASIINGQRRRSLAYQSPTALNAAAAVQ